MCIVLVAAPVRSLIIATATAAAAAALVPASAPAAAAATLAPTSASALPTLYSRSFSWQQAKFTCLSAFFPCVRVCVRVCAVITTHIFPNGARFSMGKYSCRFALSFCV